MSLRAITTREFQLLRDLIERESSIHLTDVKRELLVGRLSGHARALGCRSFGEYYARVTARGAEPDRMRMLDLISTNETRFFREAHHFRLLEERIVPEWIAAHRAGSRTAHARVWSAASSSGEEAYSVAMLLDDRLSGWHLEILGTDLSTRVLDRAKAGLWRLERSRDIPKRLLRRHMLRGVGPSAGLMKAGAQIRQHVRFMRLNLGQPPYPISGGFDVVFLCNVLIYFSAETKRRVIAGILDKLAPGGYLFLGQAECLLMEGRLGLEQVGPAAYRLPETPSLSRRHPVPRRVTEPA
jgi:chemotaxis protein methyltransferase CheR